MLILGNKMEENGKNISLQEKADTKTTEYSISLKI
jgi:hypothetical protein